KNKRIQKPHTGLTPPLRYGYNIKDEDSLPRRSLQSKQGKQTLSTNFRGIKPPLHSGLFHVSLTVFSPCFCFLWAGYTSGSGIFLFFLYASGGGQANILGFTAESFAAIKKLCQPGIYFLTFY